MNRPLLFVLLSVFAQALVAQTLFIPDTDLRTWLNAAKPGVVDASGNCDTLMWNNAPPSTTDFDLNTATPGDTVDLEGIQYLKMPTVNVNDPQLGNVALVWPGLPRLNASLNLDQAQFDRMLGNFLPWTQVLQYFKCTACGITNLPDFNGRTDLNIRDVDLGSVALNMPTSLERLYLYNCNISALPPLPSDLRLLEVSNNPLTAWPTLPSGLLTLHANYIPLNYLPPTMPALLVLGFQGNNATTLPPMPAGLATAYLSYNAFTTIPPLPATTRTIFLRNNPITVVSGVPAAAEVLYLDTCPVVTVQPLPNNLRDLVIRPANALTTLPAQLPDSLRQLRIHYATNITCLPPLPQRMISLNLYGSGVTCLPNLPPNLNTGLGESQLGIPAVVCNVTTSPCPTPEPKIAGLVFDDADQNGVYDTGEGVRPYSVVSAQPGDLLTGADMNGNYVLPADIGTFTVTGVPELYENVTTAPASVTLSAMGEVSDGNDVGLYRIPGMYDLVTTLTATNARPGFDHHVWLQVRNVGTEPTDGAVQLTYDAIFTWQQASLTPTTQVGNTTSWVLGTIAPGEVRGVYVSLVLPPSTVLGTPFQHSATATPGQPDQTPANNSSVLNDIVVGSYDPNDKRVEPSSLFQQQVQNGEHVTYTVRFQNTGTFPAERVLITDTLSADLQHGTLRVLGASHEQTWWVRRGVLHVLFDGIDLPDSTSDEANSHGFVRFTIVPTADLLPGESVGNIANIYFDFNEPIITDTALFTIDLTSSVQRAAKDEWRIAPNPVTDRLTLHGPQLAEGARVEVVDLTGTVVRTASLRSLPMTLDVAGLAPGIYFLRRVDGGLLGRFVKG